MLSDDLSTVLRSGRDHFNAEFATARRRHRELDGDAFSTFVRDSIDPIAVSVGQVRPERVSDVVLAAYRVALDLVGLDLVGPRAKQPFMTALWRHVLPALAVRLADAPARLLASLSNAVHQLSSVASARPHEWLSVMERVGPLAPNVDALLQLGQLSAWRSGLAHYRESALAVAEGLPAELALAALGAPETASWAALSVQLRDDPWFDPRHGARAQQALSAGSFRGFGGLFIEPPRVRRTPGHFVVSSGSEAWLLFADVFGCTFQRARPEELGDTPLNTGLPSGLSVVEGELRAGSARFAAPILGQLISVAYDARTLALTCSLSHALILVPWSDA